MTDTVSAAELADRLDALWLEMNDALAEPPATARILNALHDAAQALALIPPRPDALPGDQRERVACPTCRGAHPELCSDVFRISHPAPVKPTGDMRERVARFIDPQIFRVREVGGLSDWGEARMTETLERADAILALIQTERA